MVTADAPEDLRARVLAACDAAELEAERQAGHVEPAAMGALMLGAVLAATTAIRATCSEGQGLG